MQLNWYSFSSWPHIDIMPLGRSVIWPHFFLQQRYFWDRIIIVVENHAASFAPQACHCDQ